MQLISILDFVFLFFMIGLTLYGYTKGLVVQAAKLIEVFASCFIAEVAAILLSQRLGAELSYQWLQKLPWSKEVTAEMIKEFAQRVSHGVFFLVIFLVLHLVLSHIVGLLDIVDKIPVVGFLDSFGGGIFGFLQAFVWIFVIGSVLLAFAPQDILADWGFTAEKMKHSIYFKMFL